MAIAAAAASTHPHRWLYFFDVFLLTYTFVEEGILLSIGNGGSGGVWL